jgi:ABC-type transport system substrate-binding protein
VRRSDILKTAGLVSIIGISTILLCFCGGAPAGPDSVPEQAMHGGVLRFVQEGPRSLDPRAADSVYESLPINQLFDTLVALDPSLNLKPALAESWTVSKDERSFTFTLRGNVRFHNGQLLEADDVAFTIYRHLDPDGGRDSLAFSYLLAIEGAKEYSQGGREDLPGLEIIDSLTLRITLVHPYLSFLEVLAMDDLGVVPKEVVERVGDEEFGRSPVGTGPFKLADWNDDRLRLEAYRQYYGGRPFLDAVEINFLQDGEEDFGAGRFLGGDVDVLEPPTRSLERLSNESGVYVYRYQEMSLSFLGLNTMQPPLDQLWLRQAIGHAMNRQALVEDSPAVRRKAVGILPPGISGYSPEPKTLGYSPLEAKRLLAEAGYPNGEGLPPIKLSITSTGPAVQRVLDRLRGDLEAVGIKLEIVRVSWAELGDQLEERTAHSFILGWVADLTDPDSFLRSMFEPDGSANYFGYRSAETAALLERGARECNPVARAGIYRDLERRILADAPMVPLYHSMGVVAMREYVRGFKPGPMGMAKVELEKVWLNMSGSAS